MAMAPVEALASDGVLTWSSSLAMGTMLRKMAT